MSRPITLNTKLAMERIAALNPTTDNTARFLESCGIDPVSIEEGKKLQMEDTSVNAPGNGVAVEPERFEALTDEVKVDLSIMSMLSLVHIDPVLANVVVTIATKDPLAFKDYVANAVENDLSASVICVHILKQLDEVALNVLHTFATDSKYAIRLHTMEMIEQMMNAGSSDEE